MNEKKAYELKATVSPLKRLWGVLIGSLALGIVLLWVSSYSFLLFHSLAEIFSIVIAFSIFLFVWNARFIIDNKAILLIGLGYAFISLLDLVHALAYVGIKIFPNNSANLATELWVATRYFQAALLLGAPFFLKRRLPLRRSLAILTLITVFILLIIFVWKSFPVCFVPGYGLTPFKKASEYLISVGFVISIALFWRRKQLFSKDMFYFFIAAIAITVISEISFALYADPYGFFNKIGHLCKILASFLMYKAIIETGVLKPNRIIFANLKKREEELADSLKRYQMIIDYAPLHISVVNLHRKFEVWNRYSEKTYGYTAEEAIGKMGPPELLTSMQQVEEIRRVIDQKGIFEGEVRERRKDNTVTISHLVVVPYRNPEGQTIGYYAFSEDISERKAAEKEIAKIARFPNENPNPVLRVDAQGMLLYANPKAGPVLEHWGCRLRDRIPADLCALAQETLAANEKKVRELKIGDVEYSFIFTPIAEEGYVNIYADDITQRKKLENYLQEAHDRLELEVMQRTAELSEANIQLNQQIDERERIEKSIRTRNVLLKLLHKVHTRKEYLDAVVKLVRGWTSCGCVGVRLLNEEGGIPYESSTGFDEAFWQKENWLSLVHDQCVCVRVLKGIPEPQDIKAMTKGGAFVCGNTRAFFQTLTVEEKMRFRGACVEHGYTSLAVIPIRYREVTIAVIHIADRRDNAISRETVELLELMTPLIGEGIHKFNMEDRILQTYVTQSVINALLRLSLKEVDVEEILQRALDILLSLNWLAFEPVGGIFLTEKEGQLVLKVHKGLTEGQQKQCSRIKFKECLCGMAAETKKIQYAAAVDDSHRMTYGGIQPHGHYCVPIVYGEKVYGVISIHIPAGQHRDPRKEEFLAVIANALAGILQRKQIENELFEMNQILERVFASTNFLIAYLDPKFNFIRVNEAYARQDGRRTDYFIGKNHFDLYPNEENKAIFVSVVKTGEPYIVFSKPFVYARNPERGVTYWDWSLQPVKDNRGRVESLVFCLVDVTKRKIAEEELKAAQQELERSKRLSDIGTLAATIAHELRNPLGVIRTAAYNIKRKAQNPQLDGHLANIEKKITESDQIINNLLFYTRLKRPQYESVDFSRLLSDSVETIVNRFSKWEVTVSKNFSSIKDDAVECDPLQMAELFNNLLSNAFEAQPDKKGKVELRATKDGQGNIEVSVKDSGVGIDEADVKNIFEPFFTKKTKGTGLGLAVCYQIVTLHGGRIDVSSQKGKGATFTVVFPQKRKQP